MPPWPEWGHQEEVVILLKNPLEHHMDQRQWRKSMQEGVGPLVGRGVLSQGGVLLCPGE